MKRLFCLSTIFRESTDGEVNGLTNFVLLLRMFLKKSDTADEGNKSTMRTDETEVNQSLWIFYLSVILIKDRNLS